MDKPLLSESLDEIAKLLLEQRVVFFIGAGFSVDSEPLTTNKIMFSLLCRFLAWTSSSFLPEGEEIAGIATKELEGKRQALAKLFDLPINKNGYQYDINWFKSSFPNIFAKQYYEFNEWMVTLFDELFRKYIEDKKISLDELEKIIVNLNDREKAIREAAALLLNKSESEILVGFTPLKSELIRVLLDDNSQYKRVIGKVVFIEAVGLGNNDVMKDHTVNERVDLPRFKVMGCLAKEGLLPTVLTTNYDFLIQRGYYAAGLVVDCSSGKANICHLPQEAKLINKPADFFLPNSSLNPVEIIKIHGCAQQYREVRDKMLATPSDDYAKQRFLNYLSSIVYTYREIQHWRDDAWSRDYLQSLLRSRTFVFCGYSMADTVLHHTIRSIYEEMGRKLAIYEYLEKGGGKTEESPFSIPAYSTAGCQSLGFDALEVLNAASIAVKKEIVCDDHTHFLRVAFGLNGFPNSDDMMRCLLHKTTRELQLHILHDNLVNMVFAMFGKSKPPSEIEQIIKGFKCLINDSKKLLEIDCCNKTSRYLFEGELGWTERFIQKWLILVQCIEENSFSGPKAYQFEAENFYVPLRENTVWTCLGIILELAIRAKVNEENSKVLFYPIKNKDDAWLKYMTDDGLVGFAIESVFTVGLPFKGIKGCKYTHVWKYRLEQGLWSATVGRIGAMDSREMDNNSMNKLELIKNEHELWLAALEFCESLTSNKENAYG